MTMPVQLSTYLTVFYSANMRLHLQAILSSFAMVADVWI